MKQSREEQKRLVAYLDLKNPLTKQLLRWDTNKPLLTPELERKALGISKAELCWRLKIKTQTFDKFLKRLAKGKVQLRTLRNVAQALECDVVLCLVPRKANFSQAANGNAKRNERMGTARRPPNSTTRNSA